MTARPVLIATMLVSASAASAGVSTEIATIDRTLKACIDKDSSNIGMKICTGDADDAADKVLNRVYATAVAGLKQAKPGGPDDGSETLNG